MELTEGSSSVSVAIHDTGPGFPDELRSHAFDLFTRGRRSSQGTGSGLGLGVVAAVAKAHGGSASIDDEATGTVVTLTLARDGSPR